MASVTGSYWYSLTRDIGAPSQFHVNGYVDSTNTGDLTTGNVTGTEIGTGDGTVSILEELNISFSNTVDETLYGTASGHTYQYIGYVSGGQGNQYIFGDENNNYWMAGILPAGNATLNLDEGSSPLCFLAGTMIAMPDGERAVEQLAIGDTILTASGETRAVRWIGRQGVAALFADPLRAFPVRIAAGALAENVPARDLFVSPSHGVMVDGLLAEAASLVNGTSITRVTEPDQHFTWYHIETEDHAVILAEGTAVESFVDNATRANFDNYAEFLALHGEPDTAIVEMGAPRVKSARQLPAHIREELELRAHALGLASKWAA